MRYVIVIADGSAITHDDNPDLYAALDGAQTPALDAMGRLGKIGAAATAAGGAASFSRGALALLGLDDGARTVSNAVVEARALGVALSSDDTVLRIGLLRVSPDDREGLALGGCDAGPEEAGALLDDLADHWRNRGLLDGVEIIGNGFERLLVVSRGDADLLSVEMVDPASFTGERWVEHLPDGGPPHASEWACALISESRHFLAMHPVNAARTEQGLDPVNLAWVWDAGRGPEMPTDQPLGADAAWLVDEGFGAGEGVCRLLGAEPTIAPEAEIARLASAEAAPVVVLLVRRCAEELDRSVAGPLLETLAGSTLPTIHDLDDADWRLLVAISHDPKGLAGGGGGLTPFALAGGRVRSVVDRRLSGAVGSDLRVDPANELLEYVLRSGLRGIV